MMSGSSEKRMNALGKLDATSGRVRAWTMRLKEETYDMSSSNSRRLVITTDVSSDVLKTAKEGSIRNRWIKTKEIQLC